MRAFYLILTLALVFFANCTNAQNYKVKLHINILPALKDSLKIGDINIRTPKHGTSYFTSRGYGEIDSLDKHDFINLDYYPKDQYYAKGFSTFFFLDSTNLSEAEINNISITFPQDCAFNRHAFNNVCPKCKKKDKVGPILYGLLVTIYDKNGVEHPFPDKYYPAGCEVSDCDPSWYCYRDKLKF